MEKAKGKQLTAEEKKAQRDAVNKAKAEKKRLAAEKRKAKEAEEAAAKGEEDPKDKKAKKEGGKKKKEGQNLPQPQLAKSASEMHVDKAPLGVSNSKQRLNAEASTKITEISET